MLTRTPLVDGPVSVAAYHCTSGPAQRPYPEHHGAWSVAYVRRGSFGCACRGRHFELVPGSVMLGRPGDEYTCTHDHHDGGDECTAFFFDAALADEVGAHRNAWQSGALPPLAELMSLGELAQPSTDGTGPGLAEIGVALASRVTALLHGRSSASVRPRPTDRKRAVASALWIDAHCEQPCSLPQLASQSGLSVYHYLRVFCAVLGVTPHQYLVRSRLRRAARLLRDSGRAITDIAYEVGFEDLSNFTRSFRRVAGVSPRGYRAGAGGNRNFFQVRGATRA